MNDSVLALPFDQYQRYRLVADLLARLRGTGPRLDVLDVGGRTAVLRSFVEDARITLVDVERSDQPGLVLGDGSRLPFKDRCFDAVCAFDTLEHVPPERRVAFVSECRRVARRWVILAGPYQSARVAEAEDVLQRFLERKLGQRHRYLDEHRRNQLPERESVERQLCEQGGRVVAIGHGNLDRWLVLQCMSMYMDYDPALRPLARDFQRFYNAELYASDHAEPVYRHVVVAAFDDAELPQVEGLLHAPTAPAGALRNVFDLAAELVHFDRERDAWRKERALFERGREDLQAYVEADRGVIAELREAERRLTQSVVRLQAELARGQKGADATIAELRKHVAGLEALVANLRQHNAGLEATVETLRADLDGHRSALADRERGLAQHAEVIAELERLLGRSHESLAELHPHATALETERAVLRAELEGHRQALADVRADLQGHRSALANVRADLQGHAAALANERAERERLNAALAAAQTEAAAAKARSAELASSLSRTDYELNQTLSLATGLERSMAERELAYDQLRAELRSRWRNLLRVFRPRL